MAEMIPETISASAEATPGEQRVFRVLRDSLQPDEDFVVWFEPKAVRKLTDFLIWSNRFGLLIVEVKDWDIGSIRQINPNEWQIHRRGVLEICDSPTEQARKCFIQFKQLFEKHKPLCHNDQKKPGRLRFPIGYTAIFTRITKSQAAQHGILDVLKGNVCLFDDDLKFDVNNYEACQSFLGKLQSVFKAPFPFNPLSPDEFKLLRFLIFPEIRINNIRELRSARDAQMIKVLDLRQEQIAKSIPEGHRVLKGVAGSGKSLVLAFRAKYLATLHSDWRILVVCYGISFSRFLRTLIDGIQSDSNNAQIDVFHYHGLVKHLTNQNLQPRPGEAEHEWDKRVGTTLLDALEQNRVSHGYEAILVDEAQDFTLEWLLSLTILLNAETDSLLLCVDPAQNIFGRQITYKRAGIRVQGKKSLVLKRSYRNTVEILELARIFSKVPEEIADVIGEEDGFGSPLFPTVVKRHGEEPIIIQNLYSEKLIGFLLDEIHHQIMSAQCSWGDIAVLYAVPPSSLFLQNISQLFSRRFGKARLCWVTEDRDAKLMVDFASDTVKLCTIESAKGMEFRIVYLLGLEDVPRRGRDQERERRLVYVGLTRAQDMLFVLANARIRYFQELADAHLSRLNGALAATNMKQLPTFTGQQQAPSHATNAGSKEEEPDLTDVGSNKDLASLKATFDADARSFPHSSCQRGHKSETFQVAGDFTALRRSSFYDLYTELKLQDFCYTPEAAQEIVDRVASALSLAEKETLPQRYSNRRDYLFRDINRFLCLSVSISAIPGTMPGWRLGIPTQNRPCWSFHCVATRVDLDMYQLWGNASWRDHPSRFAEDAWYLINELKLLQSEGNGRFLGEVSDWKPDRGFGWLHSAAFGEIFFHKNGVRKSDRQYVRKGEQFSFVCRKSKRKPGSFEAIEIEYRPKISSVSSS